MTVAAFTVLAHGIGGIRDLPVPGWLFLYGAAVVLVVSFVALGTLWRRPLLERPEAGSPLPPALQRVLLSRALRVGLGGISFALLVLVALTALLGERSPLQNLAPTFVYVVFWLGLVPVVVLLGNVWPLVNPWRAAADAVAWLWTRTGRSEEPVLEYPAWLGLWPGAVLLASFTALELTYSDPSDPRALALAICLYSAIVWMGMAVFGRRAWLANGEAFSVYFGLLGRISPLALRRGERGREIVARPPLTGLASLRARPGTLAFVAAMLGSVAFDGISRTAWWVNRSLQLSNVSGMLFNLAGLLGAIALVALAYLAAVTAARMVAHREASLAGAFVASLVPIALAYAVAHYFSLLVLQGQFAITLASDPFGRGWDLLGTSDFRPRLGILSPNLIWYVQVAALVVGHVIGLMVAHDRALSLFRSAQTTVRTQYAMLALMVLYTVGGLWLLSNG
ncbi:MAG TPA: hypothetical protein VES61_06115 [Gaiellaceae bacterium]|nr:hypothetical protein [Gaiellaceae bacterium]